MSFAINYSIKQKDKKNDLWPNHSTLLIKKIISTTDLHSLQFAGTINQSNKNAPKFYYKFGGSK